MPILRSPAAVLLATALAPCGALASPLSYVTAFGSVETRAGDGPNTADRYTTQSASFGAPTATVPAGFAESAAARSTGTVVFDSGTTYPQVAGATASGAVVFGALHGSATAVTQTSRYWYETFARASSSAGWFDTITFHTSRAGGVDFAYSITLDDALATALRPFADPTYLGGTVRSNAFTGLNVSRGSQYVDGLSITDSVVQEPAMDGYPGGYLNRQAPARRTEEGVVHVNDGDVLSFEQTFFVTAESDNLDAWASAIANDTAFFDLRSLDPDASYTAASGTRYAVVGDPDAAVGPTPGTIPEPSIVALLFAALGGLVGSGRRFAPQRLRASIGRRGRVVAAALVATAVPLAARAAPLSYVTNYESAYSQAADASSTDGYAFDDRRVGDEYDVNATPGAIQSVASFARGVEPGTVGAVVSTADGRASGRANFGALHGSAGVATYVSSGSQRATNASALTFSSWYDTITFHTSDPGGVDFHYAITMDAMLASTGGAGNPSIGANAGSTLAVEGPTHPFYELQLFQGTYDGVSGRTTTTAEGVLHVQDGDVVAFFQNFQAFAVADFVTAAASAIADDTSYFDLFSDAPGAWYTSASGTLYATHGDPDLVGPGPGGTVPEPSSVALLIGGAGLVAVARRRPAGIRSVSATARR